MRRRYAVAVLACAGAGLACGKSTPATADSATPAETTTRSFDRKAARAEILRADSAMMRGLASRNLDSLMRYYDPDVVSMTQGTKPVKGMGSVRSSYAEVLTANPSDLSFESGGLSFSNDGSLAWHYGTFEATANDPKGKPVKAAGNFLQIWKRTGQRWVIVAEINNSSSQPRQ
ncbi:MAG TPA: nuclear transport factor 2 family protein [Gemmatimonadaceae bacterium]|jgi:ketosteroid isomerase-like protein